VCINSRNKDLLELAARKIYEQTEKQPLILPGDLEARNTPHVLVEAILKKFNKIDILVANAGGPPSKPFMDTTENDWEKGITLQLRSAIALCREVIPSMIREKWGRILFITSIAVKQPLDGLIISNAIRAGVTGFAKTLSNELASHQITVNTVMPGFTKTERLDDLAGTISRRDKITMDEAFQKWVRAIPLQRLGRPQDFGDIVAFLSGEPAGYITGAAIPVDGGLSKFIL
jgi:3-oxoacyl-[acyl-carrier protein] reductase